MKSTLTDAQIEALLDDAEAEFPTSEFVASVREWFEEHGFITDAQERSLQKIAEGE